MIGGLTQSVMTNDRDAIDLQFVGDVLLVFGPEWGALHGRNQTSPVSLLAQDKEWSLYSFPTTQRWKGYPIAELEFQNWRIWLLGEIYGVPDEDETNQIIKDCILGIRDFAKLNGHYLIFGWNSEKKQWNVWTNRLGTIHAYLTKNAIGTCFNSIAKTAGNLDLDYEGILGFFNFGFFPQNRTYCKGVRIIRPSTHEIFDSKGQKISEKRYWRWSFNPDTARSYENTVEEFGALLDDVMSDLSSNGRISVPISGGLDSRSTIAALTKQNHDTINRIRAYSYGYTPDSVEIRIARRVASARNIPFDSFLIPNYLFDSLSYILDAVEGFQDVTQSRQASVEGHLREWGDYVIAAHWGDVWLDDPDAGELRNDDEILFGALKKFQKRGRDWLIRNVSFGQNVSHEMFSEMIRQELSELEAIDDPEFRLKALKTEQWSFRWTTSSLRAYQLGAFPRLPFYDTRMIDFFTTVPSDFVRERRMQVDYIKRFAPDLARIPWQVFDANLYNYKHHQTWLLPKRAFRKVQRVLSGKKQIQRNWEAQFLNEQGRLALKQYLCGGAGTRIDEFFSPNSVESLLDELFNSPSPENGYAASILLTFAAWLGKHA